jgi:hypothetical protein
VVCRSLLKSPEFRRTTTEIDNQEMTMFRKLKSGKNWPYSRKVDPRTGKRRNLGTFDTRKQAEEHERAVQFFMQKHLLRKSSALTRLEAALPTAGG